MSVRRDVALGDATVLARRIRVYATAFATFLFAFCGVLFDLVEALYALEMRTQLVLETGVSRLCCALEHHARAPAPIICGADFPDGRMHKPCWQGEGRVGCGPWIRHERTRRPRLLRPHGAYLGS